MINFFNSDFWDTFCGSVHQSLRRQIRPVISVPRPYHYHVCALFRVRVRVKTVSFTMSVHYSVSQTCISGQHILKGGIFRAISVSRPCQILAVRVRPCYTPCSTVSARAAFSYRVDRKCSSLTIIAWLF